MLKIIESIFILAGPLIFLVICIIMQIKVIRRSKELDKRILEGKEPPEKNKDTAKKNSRP
jgi:hypothetical protein